MPGKITRQELDQTIVTPLNSIDATVSSRASQASLDTLSTIASARASQASLDAVSAIVSARATQTSLDAVSTAVSARATQTSVNTIAANVGSNADIASATGSIHAKLKDIKASSGVDLMAIPSDVIQFERLGAVFSSPGTGTGEEHIVAYFAINVSGAVRITFNSRFYGGGWLATHYSIRRNGSILFQIVSHLTSLEHPFLASHDVSVGFGDVIEIHSSQMTTFSDFRIGYTLVQARAVLLNSSGGLIHHQ